MGPHPRRQHCLLLLVPLAACVWAQLLRMHGAVAQTQPGGLGAGMPQLQQAGSRWCVAWAWVSHTW